MIPERAPDGQDTFVVDLDGFEGPLDLLLDLARTQKVDLAKISVLALAEQFLAYLREVHDLQLDIAAEYLVMAAWLTFLKSQLLLPREEREEPDAEGLAEALTDRLRKLDALRRAGAMLLARPLLGEDRLERGAPEPVEIVTSHRLQGRLADLLTAYSRVMTRGRKGGFVVQKRRLVSVEDQLARLARLLTGHTWQELRSFLPHELEVGTHTRSAIAASLLAGLELAKRGEVEIEQTAAFGPIFIKRRAMRKVADG